MQPKPFKNNAADDKLTPRISVTYTWRESHVVCGVLWQVGLEDNWLDGLM